MTIWDIEPRLLCSKHLTELHDDIHAAWNMLTVDEYAHTHHPELKRWKGKLKALHERHDDILIEFARRGIEHDSSLNYQLANGDNTQTTLIQTIDEQFAILAHFNCNCLRSF